MDSLHRAKGSINININLKLESKYVGKKITQHQELPSKEADSLRLNVTTESLRKRKSIEPTQHKRSLFDFGETKNENSDVSPLCSSSKEKSAMRREKSKSMHNIKLKRPLVGKPVRKEAINSKQFERSKEKKPEKSPRPKSKSISRSKSKSRSKSQGAKEKSYIKVKEVKQFERSASRDTSPCILRKKSSVNVKRFSRSKSRDASPIPVKKTSLKAVFKKHNQCSQTKLQSVVKVVTSNTVGSEKTGKKQQSKVTGKAGKKKEGKKKEEGKKEGKKEEGKKSKASRDRLYYHQMARRIQSAWRGYIFRKRFRDQIQEIAGKAAQIRACITQIGSPFWNFKDDTRSVYNLDTQHKQEQEEHGIEGIVAQTNRTPTDLLLQEQMLSLRKQIESRDQMFRLLKEENQALKDKIKREQQISRIEEQNKKKEEAEKLIVEAKRLQLEKVHGQFVRERIIADNIDKERMQSKRMEREKLEEEKKKQTKPALLLELREMGVETDWMESPKNVDFTNSLFVKLMEKKQEEINRRYLKQSEQNRSLAHLVSPRSYDIKCQQLKNSFRAEKYDTIQKLKNAEKALLFIRQMDEDSVSQDHSGELSQVIRIDDQDESPSHGSEALFGLALSGSQAEHILSKVDENAGHNEQLELEKGVMQFEYSLSDNVVPAQKDILDTSMEYIKTYCVILCEYFRSVESFKKMVLDEVSSELKIDGLVLMRSFRTMVEKQDGEESASPKLLYTYFRTIYEFDPVFPLQIFTAMSEHSLLTESDRKRKEAEEEQKSAQGYSMYELKQCHDMAIFDAFNEALNFQRPGGVNGSQLKFLTQDYTNVNKAKNSRKFSSPESEHHIDVLMSNAIGRMINQWASCLCGFINNEPTDKDELTEAKIKEIRKVREVLMLRRIISSEDQSYTDFTLDCVYSKICLAEDIQNILLQEISVELVQITRRRRWLPEPVACPKKWLRG